MNSIPRKTLAATVGIAGLIVGLTVAERRANPPAPRAVAASAPRSSSIENAGAALRAVPAYGSLDMRATEATMVERGYVPVSRIAAPPSREPPPAPRGTEPPDPASFTPPMHNPGGADGDRPARPIPH